MNLGRPLLDFEIENIIFSKTFLESNCKKKKKPKYFQVPSNMLSSIAQIWSNIYLSNKLNLIPYKIHINDIHISNLGFEYNIFKRN